MQPIFPYRKANLVANDLLYISPYFPSSFPLQVDTPSKFIAK